MRKIKLLFGLLSVITFFLTGCKDDEIPAVEYKSQGFIKGTITGTTIAGTNFTESFSYTKYSPALQGGFYSYYEEDGGELEFSLFRADPATSSEIYLGFTLLNEDDTTPDDLYLELEFIKEQGNTIFYFGIDDDPDNTFTITDFSFSEGSGRVKGHYKIVGPDNSTGNNATVEGDFDVVVKKRIY